MNTVPPKIERPALLGLAAATAALSLLAACLGLMAVATRAPAPATAHNVAD